MGMKKKLFLLVFKRIKKASIKSLPMKKSRQAKKNQVIVLPLQR